MSRSSPHSDSSTEFSDTASLLPQVGTMDRNDVGYIFYVGNPDESSLMNTELDQTIFYKVSKFGQLLEWIDFGSS